MVEAIHRTDTQGRTMKRATIYIEPSRNTTLIKAITGDVKGGGDGWTLVTAAMRRMTPRKRYFTLGASSLVSKVREGARLGNDFILGVSRTAIPLKGDILR